MAEEYSEFVRFELPLFSTEDLRELEQITRNLYKGLAQTSKTTDTVYTHARWTAIRAELLIRDCNLKDVATDELHTLKKTMPEDIQIHEAIEIVLLRRGIV